MGSSDWSSDVCSSGLAARRRTADRAAGGRRRHAGAAGAVSRRDDLAAPGGTQARRCARADGGAGREDAGVSALAVRLDWSDLDDAQRAAALARPTRTVSRELREGVAAILDQVRARGETALRGLTLRLAGADLDALFVDKRECALAAFAFAPGLRLAMAAAPPPS